MPRAPLILQNQFPYSLCARSNNKDWFQIPLNECWSIFEEKLARTHEQYGFETHQFVLMANHFHWLATTPHSNLDEGMRFFMTETSRSIARSANRINRIYGARYKPCLISTPAYYANTFRYIYQNPIRAGVCKTLNEYPFSTYHPSSKIKLTNRSDFSEFIPQKFNELETWLNVVPDQFSNDRIRRALRRAKFKLPPHPTKRTDSGLMP